MKTRYSILVISTALQILLLPIWLYAQVPEGAGARYIRVAEMGQLVDSVNVWGDVGSSGRYLIPIGTKLPELISFSMGYTESRGSFREAKWAKTLIEVKVSRYIKNRKLVKVAFFRYIFNETEPVEMFEFDLQNNDIVTVQVQTRPTITDYINVIAPVIGVAATSFLLIENLRGN